MGEESKKQGCVQPAKGPLVGPGAGDNAEAGGAGGDEAARAGAAEEAAMVTARVGREAIDFEANAYVEGEGFRTVKLSDYRGRWIVLCFYPGDFTFV